MAQEATATRDAKDLGIGINLAVNLMATALWVLIGLGANQIFGLSEKFSLSIVGVFVFVGGSLFIFILSTNALKTIRSPYTAIILLLLVLSVVINAYFFIKPYTNGTVEIQSLQPSISTWGADYDGDPKTGGSASFNVRYLGNSNAEYAVNYTLPDGKDNVWSGVVFAFPQKQDFTQYKTLKLRIVFGDLTDGGDSEANSLLEINSEKDKAEFDLRKTEGLGTVNERTVIIDLKDVQGVDLKSVVGITFKQDGRYPHGGHSYTVSSIELTR